MKKVLLSVLSLALLLGTVGCSVPVSDPQGALQAETLDYYQESSPSAASQPASAAVTSDSCDVSEITIDGTSLEGFSSGRTQYWYSVSDITEAPTVGATAVSQLATVEIDSTVQQATVTVTNGENSKTYTVTFVDTATYDEYNLGIYTLPYWDGNIVYNETIMFVIDNEAPLLYEPDTILSVRSSDLKTEYVRGTDYDVVDGKIVRLEGSSMPYFTEAEWYPASKDDSITDQTQNCNVPGKPYIIFSEGHYFYEHQVVVTYTHTDEWEGFIPQKSEALHRFVERAEAGEELNVVFFGDSITAGGNPSGQGDNTVAPYTPRWSTMVTAALQARFSNATITEINTAVGGKDSDWGFDVHENAVIAHDPDLLVLAFGMNDTNDTPTHYAANIKKIVKSVLKANPECEILLVSTMLPHDELTKYYGNQSLFEAKLYGIAAQYEKNVDVAPMTSVHTAVLESKRYVDMTGNNVNHPTDYLTRLYAQTVLRTLLGDYWK